MVIDRECMCLINFLQWKKENHMDNNNLVKLYLVQTILQCSPLYQNRYSVTHDHKNSRMSLTCMIPNLRVDCERPKHRNLFNKTTKWTDVYSYRYFRWKVKSYSITSISITRHNELFMSLLTNDIMIKSQ